MLQGAAASREIEAFSLNRTTLASAGKPSGFNLVAARETAIDEAIDHYAHLDDCTGWPARSMKRVRGAVPSARAFKVWRSMSICNSLLAESRRQCCIPLCSVQTVRNHKRSCK
jgi:hypothetical protein